jgi:TetR/AcrR family transcriptional repressor of nem operon
MTKTKKITNRDVVLLTARNLFLTQGYLATSMDEIVITSKVSKTNIYYYFKSKEELLGAILDQLVLAYTRQMQEITARSDCVYRNVSICSFKAWQAQKLVS